MTTNLHVCVRICLSLRLHMFNEYVSIEHTNRQTNKTRLIANPQSSVLFKWIGNRETELKNDNIEQLNKQSTKNYQNNNVLCL